jgi:hypothetical protein
MDQAASANQGLLRHQRERGENANLDRGVDVCAGGDRAKRLGLEASLYQILQILSVTLFEKTPIVRALQNSNSQSDLLDYSNQLILFNL